jgi:hypothetical protein
MAEDGVIETHRVTGQPRSGRRLHPGSFILHARKAGDSNATVLAAHRLAGEPGT